MGSRIGDGPWLFERTGDSWPQQAVLGARVESVAMDGDTAVVGLPDHYHPTGGEAYVFRRIAGDRIQQTILQGSDATEQALFGSSLAISRETIVVGARRNSDGLPGAAYVFVRKDEGWIEQAKLMAGEARGEDDFGGDVAIDGGTIAVAGGNLRAESSPIAYVFTRNGEAWTEEPPIARSPDLDRVVSVALSGDTLLAGSNGAEAAYVFVRAAEGWSLQATLQAWPSYNFGYSVALSGDIAIVGSLAESPGPELNVQGHAYAFSRSAGEWSEPTALVPDQTAVSGGFGWPVAMSGNTAAVGAAWDSEKGERAGAVYLFDLTSDPAP